MEGFTTQQVAQLTGVNRKTLHYWDRSGFLCPRHAKAHGTGTRRRYSFRDLLAARLAHQFRRQGISLQGLRRIVQFLQHEKQSPCPLAEMYLVTDGEDVYATKGDGVVSVLRQPGQACLFFVLNPNQIVVGLSDTVATLQQAVHLLSTDDVGRIGDRKRKADSPGKIDD